MMKNLIKLKKATMKDLSISWIKWLNNKEVNKFSKKKNKIHTYQSQKKYLKETLADNSKLLFMLIYQKKKVGTLLISKISKTNKHCDTITHTKSTQQEKVEKIEKDYFDNTPIGLWDSRYIKWNKQPDNDKSTAYSDKDNSSSDKEYMDF